MDLSPLSDLTAGNEVQGRRQRKQKAPKEKYFKETQIVAIVVSTVGQEEGTRDISRNFTRATNRRDLAMYKGVLF